MKSSIVAVLSFCFDEHIAHAVAAGLRRRGIDVALPAEVGMLAADDEQHLARACAEGRVLYTADSDYLALHQAGHPHTGLFFRTTRMSIGEQVRLLELYATMYEPDEWVGRLEFLP